MTIKQRSRLLALDKINSEKWFFFPFPFRIWNESFVFDWLAGWHVCIFMFFIEFSHRFVFFFFFFIRTDLFWHNKLNLFRTEVIYNLWRQNTHFNYGRHRIKHTQHTHKSISNISFHIISLSQPFWRLSAMLKWKCVYTCSIFLRSTEWQFIVQRLRFNEEKKPDHKSNKYKLKINNKLKDKIESMGA